MKKTLLALFSLFSLFSFADENNSNILRKISVTGNSEREIKPDIAKIYFITESKKDSLDAASKDVNSKIEKFKTDLKNKNIQFKNFETVSYYTNSNKEIDEPNVLNYKGVQKDSNENTEKATSYTITLNFLIKNSDFNQIANIVEFTEDNFLQSIKKDYNNNSYVFSISENDTTIDKAINKAFNKFNSIKAKLLSSSIAENNIVLGDYAITPQFNNNNNNEKTVYYATHRFQVTTNNIKDLNSLIAIASDNSINIDGNISFDISNKEEIESEMYNDAFNQAKTKANSILKSSNMTLSVPLVISEDVAFQQKMIDKIDNSWTVAAAAPVAESYRTADQRASKLRSGNVAYLEEPAMIMASKRVNIDYTPKPIKINQNISVLYEIK